MTEKQGTALNAIISALPEECRQSYRELAEYAVALGYMPSVKGVRKDYALFTNSKLKKTIMKINTDPDFRCVSIKFFALGDYNGVFHGAINDRLETWKRLGYQASCFGCGKCDGTEGYKVSLPDGTNGFLCGYSLLPVNGFNPDNLVELKEALKIQHEYFVKHANA